MSVGDKETVLLNFKERFPDEIFYAVILADGVRQFPGVHDLEGRRVAISGSFRLYWGNPEIVLTSPDQIEIR